MSLPSSSGASGAPVVGFLGSRSLPSTAAGLVASSVSAVVSAAPGVVLVAGCAAGADQLALSAALSLLPPGQLRVFAVGGPCGSGFPRPGLPPGVAAAVAAGCPVSWWSGGSPAVPLRARLAARSRALVRFVAAGGPGSCLVGFPAAPPAPGSGSWLALTAGAATGLPLVVFPCGWPPASLPLLGFGAWSPAPAPWPAGGWLWLGDL